jgi:hypothetical protein
MVRESTQTVSKTLTRVMVSYSPSSENTKELSIMTKSLDLIVESIRNQKHPFPQVVNRPAKPQKSRYERRKVREYLRLGDWRSEEAQA